MPSRKSGNPPKTAPSDVAAAVAAAPPPAAITVNAGPGSRIKIVLDAGLSRKAASAPT